MGDKHKIIAKKFTYEGLFDFKDMFRIMDVWQRDKFYDKFEKRIEQYTNPDGTKHMEYEFTPWKKVTDYFKFTLKIEVWGINIKDVQVTVNGKKKTVQQGRVDFKFTGYLVQDYQDVWTSEKKPIQEFIREIWDRYVTVYTTNKYEKMMVDHVNDLANTIQAYLNMHQYRTGF